MHERLPTSPNTGGIHHNSSGYESNRIGGSNNSNTNVKDDAPLHQHHPPGRTADPTAADAASTSHEDMMVLATAFRRAQDEDIMAAQNLMSSARSQTDVDDLVYYVLERGWLERAWPVLTYGTTPGGVPAIVDSSGTWHERIGTVHNDILLESRHTVNPNSAEAAVTVVLAPHMRHRQHFVLCGECVWFLVKRKFGCDVEWPVHCRYTNLAETTRLNGGPQQQNLDQANDTCLSVRVREDCIVGVPHSGRFPYEHYLRESFEQDSRMETNAGLTSKNVIINEYDADDDDNTNQDTDDLFPSSSPGPSSPSPILVPTGPSASSRDDELWSNDDDDDDDKSNRFGDSNSDSNQGTTLVLRRRYGSGLGNLGNTCFMNSTLQCLAHTQPLQRYFLTGDFMKDLNRDNPLGTGGDLATQFAQLLHEMWGTKRVHAASSQLHRSNHEFSLLNTANVVYPRSFKLTLGKHAEQFVGYDQHDSQELATYLLDALHEDCNRVTTKPYVEKPEKEQEETDQEASDKAWELHLRREDSKVLENFMGQVKSRVQCSNEECGRVSTTFDPFMFLSVPIPGSEQRSFQFSFVSIDPSKRTRKLTVKVPKLSSVGDLVKNAREMLIQVGAVDKENPPTINDFAVCDVWQNKIWSWREFKDDVDDIKSSDETVLYELRSLAEVQAIEAQQKQNSCATDETAAARLDIPSIRGSKRYKLDAATLSNIGNWMDAMEQHLSSPRALTMAFNPRKGSSEERVRIYRKLVHFLEQCHNYIETAASRPKRTKNENGSRNSDDESNDEIDTNETKKALEFPSMDVVPGLEEQCDSGLCFFVKVKSSHDIAVLEFLAAKMYVEILRMERQEKELFPNGFVVEVRAQSTGTSTTLPLVVRLASTTTVYALREEIARRLSRSLKAMPERRSIIQGFPADEASGPENLHLNAPHPALVDDDMGSPALNTIRQIALSYDRHSKQGTSRAYGSSKQLGSLCGSLHQWDSSNRSTTFAKTNHEEEMQYVSEIVGNKGQVSLDWPNHLSASSFDKEEFQAVDEAENELASSSENEVSVLDCIEKFCQMEQLEQSEQWYCNRCKDHVCAWKQFHIYRSPPHLIVHLKRFQFSARSHRRQKIGVHIDFPLEGLDLTQQVLHWTENEKPIYNCYAVSNHFGGLGGGHYTAYALNDDGVWCHYDDSRITANVDPSEVISNAAYVLYYRRQDVPVVKNFEMNIATPAAVGPAIVYDDVGNQSSGDVVSSAAVVDDDDEIMNDVQRSSRPSSADASVDPTPDYVSPTGDDDTMSSDSDNGSEANTNAKVAWNSSNSVVPQ